MKRITTLLLGVLFVLASLVAVSAPAQSAPAAEASVQAPPTGPSKTTPVNPKIVKGKAGEGFFDPSSPGYATADPGIAAAEQTMGLAAAFQPAPYSSLRWRTTPEDANGHPWICIGNHIGDAWQDRVNAWNDQADQLTVTYQVGTNACSGWGNNEKIDIEQGYDSARACAYVYKAWNSASTLTRVIVYHNWSKPACYSTTNPTAELSTLHWKSQAIGLGLGNLQYGAADAPSGWYNGFGVMDMSQYSYSTPDPVREDGLTYDYYN